MSKPAGFLRVITAALVVVPCLALEGCHAKVDNRIDYDMGERVVVGPLTYNVVESTWRSQLGDAFKLRLPEQRFLLLTVSVTNGGGRDISVPLLTLQNQNGQTFQELENGDGVDQWFGILRTIPPAQTQQGKILFDVPLSSYKLRLTDGGNPGSEKFAWVNIPLRMDVDTSIDTPLTPSK